MGECRSHRSSVTDDDGTATGAKFSLLPSDLGTTDSDYDEAEFAEPALPTALLTEIHFIDDLGAVGIAVEGIAQAVRLGDAEERAEKIRVGRAVEEALVDVDLEEAADAGAGGIADEIAVVALGGLAEPADLGGDEVAAVVEENLLQLGGGDAVVVIDEVDGAEVDRLPIVKVAIRDGGPGGEERLVGADAVVEGGFEKTDGLVRRAGIRAGRSLLHAPKTKAGLIDEEG